MKPNLLKIVVSVFLLSSKKTLWNLGIIQEWRQLKVKEREKRIIIITFKFLGRLIEAFHPTISLMKAASKQRQRQHNNILRLYNTFACLCLINRIKLNGNKLFLKSLQIPHLTTKENMPKKKIIIIKNWETKKYTSIQMAHCMEQTKVPWSWDSGGLLLL